LANPITPLGWSTMIRTWPSILWFDLKHLVLPLSSSEFYPLAYVIKPGFGNFGLPAMLAVVALIATGYAISKLANPRLGWFAALWVVVPILPTLYLRAIASDNFVHDRFLYFPSVGLVILAALAIEQVAASKMLAGRGAVLQWAPVAVLCIAGFVGTVNYQLQWANNILLYQSGMRSAPDNLVVQDNLANEFTGMGRYDLSIPLYLGVLKRDARFWSSNYNLGYTYYRMGRFAEAEDYLMRAVRINDQDPDQFIFLARAQMEQGKLDAALVNAERAIGRGPQSPGFHFVLAKILEAQGRRQLAMAEYRIEAAKHPENAMAMSEVQRMQRSQ
jgi:protein O-mannosyl-transferase